MTRVWLATLVLAAGVLIAPPPTAAEDLVALSASPTVVQWSVPMAAAHDRLLLTVSGPRGLRLDQEFEAGTTPTFGLFDEAGSYHPDGLYTYEIRIVSNVAAGAPGVGTSMRAELLQAGEAPARTLIQAGVFSIRDGAFVLQDPRAPSLALRDVTIDDDLIVTGNVGIGTSAPSAQLDVSKSGAASGQATSFSDGVNDAPQFVLRRADGTASSPGAVDTADNLGILSFRGYTGSAFSGSRALVAGQATENWSSSANGAKLVFSTTANGATSPTVRFEIQEDGDIVANGVVVHASSRALKENFAAADPAAVLERVANLPVTYWNYTKDGSSERHIGPVAEDFYAAFGLGEDDKHIALSDSVGVALAAVQGLHEQLQAKDQRIAALEARLAALEAAQDRR